MVSANNACWPIGVPLALSTVAGLTLLLWPGRRRLGVGTLLGTVFAALADYVLVLVILFYMSDVAVT
jgi:hypothetical protein